jgi:glycosyltransferase involved in cell wall biosynthesis
MPRPSEGGTKVNPVQTDSSGPLHMLLLAYFFPPLNGGGIPRPVKFSNHLVQQGWRVTVLAGSHEGETDPLLEVSAQVRRLPARELPRLLGSLGRIDRWVASVWARAGARQLPDRPMIPAAYAIPEEEIAASLVGWILPAIREGWRVLRSQRVDVVVATLPPAAAGVAAAVLGRLGRVPVVIDYRDPWNADQICRFDDRGLARTDPLVRARLRLSHLAEAAMLRWSDAVVIVNGQAQVDKFRRGFPRASARAPVWWIPNGVDLNDVRSVTRRGPHPPAGRIRLVHMGHFYAYRSPYYLLQGLRELGRTSPDVLDRIAVEFYGSGFPEQLCRALARWGLSAVVTVLPPVSYSESLRVAAEADGLLLLLPPLDPLRDCLPTKLYEYLAAGRPIIAVAPEGAAAELVRSSGAGVVSDPRNPSAIAAAIRETVRGIDEVALPLPADVARFDYELRAAEFARALRLTVSRRGRGRPSMARARGEAARRGTVPPENAARGSSGGGVPAVPRAGTGSAGSTSDPGA